MFKFFSILQNIKNSQISKIITKINKNEEEEKKSAKHEININFPP